MKKRILILMLVILILDLLSKWWISSNLELGESITVIPGFFWLTYARNTGAAWSIFEGARLFFIVIGVAVALILTYYFYKEKEAVLSLGAGLMLVGTLGNLIDRIRLGYVRDMFAFNLLGYPFPVFNIADTALVIGVAVIALDVLVLEKRR